MWSFLTSTTSHFELAVDPSQLQAGQAPNRAAASIGPNEKLSPDRLGSSGQIEYFNGHSLAVLVELPELPSVPGFDGGEPGQSVAQRLFEQGLEEVVASRPPKGLLGGLDVGETVTVRRVVADRRVRDHVLGHRRLRDLPTGACATTRRRCPPPGDSPARRRSRSITIVFTAKDPRRLASVTPHGPAPTTTTLAVTGSVTTAPFREPAGSGQPGPHSRVPGG